MSVENSKKPQRPLSPHLQVYKPQMTSMLSILHRMTGVALALGLVLVSAIIVSAVMGEAAYEQIMGLSKTILGQLVLAGWSFALVYHTLNGVRHLIWDTGRLFKIEDATRAGHLVFWGAVVITAGLWALAQSGKISHYDVPEVTQETTNIEIIDGRTR